MENAQILVVEDENIVALEIKSRLEGLGYVVLAIASSGEEAIQKAEETNPDLVLMDIKLKGDMDGIEAAGKIQTRFNLPVVYLTAYAEENTLQRAKITVPYGYILKPFEERELHANIEIAIYKHQMEKKVKKLILELQDALTKVKILNGLLPICASCKKIRDDEGYWTQVEEYIEKNSQATFTHGVCPECMKKLYPQYIK